ncbi:type VII secretion protein EccCa [Paeniglutamicibacter cryotolerans]|uniref:S-DNA-T family DNA segregation ATPase FtsK/SpoIIIE n=1 Tax=Paeniglutamicibacter cryotolerans TaxID=670079 RepID=A0A839QJ74_9MICC|nr:type VII secretion protein EccCa [Paeniglutamicibacter cryotolerans]MBB2994086.1 S-DNA-T family DNA segregation ATPase FtsK/SpoIIIE [Paeniglutamicibacter cryotolerans]
MTQKLIHRPARTTAPLRDFRPFDIDGPPPVEAGAPGMNMMAIVPMLGGAVSMTVMMMFRNSPFAAVGAMMMILTVVLALFMMFGQRGKAAASRRAVRDNYMRYLERTRVKLRTEEQEAQSVARLGCPPPEALFDIVRTELRVWERRRGNEDFLQVRIGTGARPCRTIGITDTAGSAQQLDAFMSAEAQILKRRYSTAPDMPITLPLDARGNVSIIGDRAFVLAVSRAILVSAAAFHSPEDLGIGLAVAQDLRADWDWADWLPHLADQDQLTTAGPVRRIAPDTSSLADLMGADLHRRAKAAAEAGRSATASRSLSRRLLLSDTHGARATELPLADRFTEPGTLGLTVLHLAEDRSQEPSEVGLRISQSADGFTVQDYGLDPVHPLTSTGVLDPLSAATAAALARELAPLRLSADSLEHDTATEGSASFLDMLGLSPALDRADVLRAWTPRSDAGFLRIPLGPDDRGKPTMLDLKESAQFGMGPHGLCVGATGSGKSEMLRSLVFGLLATHSPDLLAMVLIDFKGGATFAPFEGAPQVAGIITNLSEDLSLVERVYASLNGEILRRQEVLKAAGNIANITDYQIHRNEALARGGTMEPLPHLVVIIDEFGELLTARPDFIDLFLSIGRIGRSIGVHLLLSSQRVEAGKLRGLETYLSYRIGLRTLSESESRTVLDTGDAFHLPPVPGYGYLKVDTTVYTRFKSGYVSGPLSAEEPETRSADALEVPPVYPVPRYAAEPAAGGSTDSAAVARPAAAARTTGPTVMSTLMATLRSFPRSVQEIWLPPLPGALTLDAAAGGLSEHAAGLRLQSGGRLRVPIGILDDPARQWQGRWEIDFSAGGGNLVIVGGPQSGRSTLLRTLVASLALTHSPQEVGIYAVDLLGSGLLALAGLPHVGGTAIRTNREVVRRTVEELLGMLAVRERAFEQHGIDSLATMRALCAEGRLPELPSADVFLVIDGFGQIGDDFTEIQEAVNNLIMRGGGYGIHVITTLNRNAELRMAQQGFFGNRIETALTDPADSSIDRKVAAGVNALAPGRALSDRKLIGHVALPRIDGTADPEDLSEGLRELVRRVAESTRGTAMPVRVLPAIAPLPAAPQLLSPGLIPLGLREVDLGAQVLDATSKDRHFIVMGDEESGKSNLLRTIIATLVATHTPDELLFGVYDPRKGLDDVVPDDYLGGYAGSAAVAEQLSAALVKELALRTTGGTDDEKPGTARLVIIIDDYDVLTASGSSPMGRLATYLPMAAELNLNVFLTRKVRGAGRGMYESFFATLRDSGSGALIMSGDRSEGGLINNVRARPLPAGRGQLIQTGRPVQTIQTYFNG